MRSIMAWFAAIPVQPVNEDTCIHVSKEKKKGQKKRGLFGCILWPPNGIGTCLHDIAQNQGLLPVFRKWVFVVVAGLLHPKATLVGRQTSVILCKPMLYRVT